MSNEIAIMTTACSRPHYLARSLASWRKTRGIFGTHRFTVALGPADTETREAMATVIKASRIVTDVLPDRTPGAGLHQAIYECASHVFNDPDVGFLVFGEEDVV